MLGPDDIRRLCERKYAAFLRSIVANEPFFPLDIRFGRPSSTDEWPKLQAEITALAQGDPGYRIEWEEINTRRWGWQRLPARVWFQDERAFLRVLRRQPEVDLLRRQLAFTREACPELEGWLPANAARVIEHAGVWRELISVCRYFLQNPRPGLFARELPIPVDTKFVERHQGMLRSLLDHVLPEGARQETSHFEIRFGLRFDEPLVRMRFLDSNLRRRLAVPVDDLSVPLSQFRSLEWSGPALLIAENKMTFLTLPARENTIGIFGGGGAAELLASVRWCADCPLLYWGDLDIHGFHILARLRRAFPHLRSVMMDDTTLSRFRGLGVPARQSSYQDVATLTPAELATYRQVRDEGVLLEQEKLPQAYVQEQLGAL